MRQRFYNTDIKRFINQDVLLGDISNSQSLNRYAYVQGNPVSYSDPFGLNPMEILKASLTQTIHDMLSIATIIPGVPGAVAGMVNAFLYLCEGNYGMAGHSALNALAMLGMPKVGGVIGTLCSKGVVAKTVVSTLLIETGIYMTTTSVVDFMSNMEKLSKALESGADATTIFHLISMTICDGAGVYYGFKTTVGGATGLTSQCFVAGTIVKTEDGDKPIEEVKPGDKVWSFNPETGEEGLKEVKETFVNETDEIEHIELQPEEDTPELSNTNDKTETYSITIDCTPEHPFYVVDYGFKYASELKIGDRILSQNGDICVVQGNKKEQLEEPIKVYNFEVEDWHTYCVSEYGVVVHNMCKVNQTNSNDNTKSIPYSEYDSLSKKSIHNKSSNKVMLGKYDGGGPTSYIKKAGNEYTYFDMGDDWNKIKDMYGFTDEDMFKLFNESFLDDGINAGKTFYFSHNPIDDIGFLGKEYKYLLKNNYFWDEKTMTMSPR